ncbi:MAG: hypothetical protein QUV05_08255, partial [Phycisphaerae bacterium]|nr:hypothetical protein [Phycisphaerae bacterium]
ELYASCDGMDKFVKYFVAAWLKLMNLDRFFLQAFVFVESFNRNAGASRRFLSSFRPTFPRRRKSGVLAFWQITAIRTKVAGFPPSRE